MYYGMAPLATRSAKLLGVSFLVFNDLEADQQSSARLLIIEREKGSSSLLFVYFLQCKE
jgi:hypothetical protein